MRNKLMRFMIGRYCTYARGFDSLSYFLIVAIIAMGLLSVVLSLFPGFITWIICLALRISEFLLFVWLIFRLFSKNISKRQFENMHYIRMKTKVENYFKGTFSKTHRIYKCPQCGTKVRVPRGKGKIRITCPKCKAAFIKKT